MASLGLTLARSLPQCRDGDVFLLRCRIAIIAKGATFGVLRYRGHIPLFAGDQLRRFSRRRTVTAIFVGALLVFFGALFSNHLPCSRALLRSDGGEGRPALLDILATAVRADDVFPLMFGNGQTLRECFLAGVTEELVVGH